MEIISGFDPSFVLKAEWVTHFFVQNGKMYTQIVLY